VTFLEQILESTRSRIGEEIRYRSFASLASDVAAMEQPRDFEGALRQGGISLIAEIKRKSPSAGSLRSKVDPAKIAGAYEQAGARAISVLTEPYFFDGSLKDLVSARQAVDLPVLRKDFLVDPYQVVQARVAGADAILLIVAALTDRGLFREMAEAAKEYGLAALIEVHDAFEVEQALEVDPKIIGVNQRDLTTFEVNRKLAMGMRKEIGESVAMVAESGVGTRSQVQELDRAGIQAVLVGEAFMKADDIGEAVRGLLGTTMEAQ